MKELKPCRNACDSIKEIKMLWRGLEGEVGIIYCLYCEEVVPFKYYPGESLEDKAAEAWNKEKDL